jgi:PTH1 family peptidyl-tRNA hydrolase
VEALARQLGWSFKEEKKVFGRLAKGQLDGETIYLLLPSTYMNESGRAVRKVCDFFKLTPEEVVVVTDDIAIPFSTMRIREKGSAGGHNGLKSIELHLGTNHYVRIRMGVGEREHGSLSGHVLGRFSQDEAKCLGPFLEKGEQALSRILNGEEIVRVMNDMNARRNGKQELKSESSNGGAGEKHHD